MTDDKKPALIDDRLRFFGTITASISHEMNNVLSIINEHSGLLDDLMLAMESGRPVDPERLKRLAEIVGKQVRRGEEIVKRLNRFAHCVDDQLRSVNLNRLLDDMTALCARFASQQCVEVDLSLPDEEVAIQTNPYLARQAVYYCMRLFLYAPDRGGRLNVTLSREETKASIRFEGPALDETEDGLKTREETRALVEVLDGEFAIVLDDNKNPVIILTFPELYARPRGNDS